MYTPPEVLRAISVLRATTLFVAKTADETSFQVKRGDILLG
jgi:hypothetical protein